MSMRTPLGLARGLGSAKDGTHHWWMQRVTSVIMVPLMLWFVISLLTISRVDYPTFQHWMSRPWNAGLLLALLSTMFYHASLGMQVVYEDYVRPECRKVMAIIITNLLLLVLAAVAIVAVLKIALA